MTLEISSPLKPKKGERGNHKSSTPGKKKKSQCFNIPSQISKGGGDLRYRKGTRVREKSGLFPSFMDVRKKVGTQGVEGKTSGRKSVTSSKLKRMRLR